MSKLTKALTAAAGNAGESLYVEDVFSTYLYTGNSSTQTITNGIDLDGEGGMVWLKSRSDSVSHALFDTERGASNFLVSNATNANDSPGDLNGFNSDGFDLNLVNGHGNFNNYTYASWTFRKAEKFFDVVTYTGDGTTGRDIAHNLGSVPGCVIVKNTSASGFNWMVLHSSVGATGSRIFLNLPDVYGADPSLWNNTNPTSSVFTLGANPNVNASGNTYVAYLFASDAGGFGDDDESIIKCGSFTTGAQGKISSPVDCGFEAQWLLVKNVGSSENWQIYDVSRGMSYSGYSVLYPNLSDAAYASTSVLVPTATGFDTPNVNGPFASGASYIYIAIRRPMKTPTAGTEVFSPVARTGTGTTAAVTGVGFSPDLFIGNIRATAGYWNGVVDRLRGVPKRLVSSQTNAEDTQTVITSFDMDGLSLTSDGNGFANESGKSYIEWLFKRATGFFDVVAWTGGSTLSLVNHNLGVIPELIITKYRGGIRNWGVAYEMGQTTWNSILLDEAYSGNARPYDVAGFTGYGLWTKPTSTQMIFRSGLGGNNGDAMIGYIFATLAGVSKVGSYTGTGSNVDVDCGFSAGARFILIKRTDSTGDWYVWDSARGIVAGNDPYLLLNTTAAEVTNTDYIDPLSSGFTVTSSAPAALNASGGSYIFLAIA